MKTLLLLLVVCYVEVRADNGDQGKLSCEQSTGNRKDSLQRILAYCSTCHTADILFAAVKANDYLATKDLMVDGADVDPTDVSNYTPLCYTALNGFVKVGEVLLDYGANVGATVSTDLHKTPLHYAAQQGSVAFCDMLLYNAANLEALDDYRQSPVFYSAWQGHLNATKYLVGKGAKVDIKNIFGQTAEQVAKNSNKPEVAAWLASVS